MNLREIEQDFLPVFSKRNRIGQVSMGRRLSLGERVSRLSRRLDAEKRPDVRERLFAEVDRIFRLTYRLRMKG